jgi:hypothetical protein
MHRPGFFGQIGESSSTTGTERPGRRPALDSPPSRRNWPRIIGGQNDASEWEPIYVRGQAHLAANQPARAATEFQRILDHRSIVLVDPVDAMARLQLARALALSGETVKAKRATEIF